MNKIDILNQVMLHLLNELEEQFPSYNNSLNWQEEKGKLNEIFKNIEDKDKLEYFRQANLFLIENNIISVSNDLNKQQNLITSMPTECILNNPRLTLKGLSKISNIPNILASSPDFNTIAKKEMLKTLTKETSKSVLELSKAIVASLIM
jgi:hypothetical protein